jgi:hypothetical protein
MGDEGSMSGQPQGPQMSKAIQNHSGKMEDHTKEKVTTLPEITTEESEFEMLSQDMKMHPRYYRDMLANKHEMT